MSSKLLIAKPFVKYPIKSNGDIGIPLGLLYLANYVRERNPATAISFKDYRVEQYNGNIRNLENDLADADIIASGGSTTEIPDTLRILRTAKRLGKITVAGGIFPSSNPDYMLRSGVVDYVVRGEGEETFAELLKAIESNRPINNLPGVSYNARGTFVHNKHREAIDLSKLPLPAYDLAPMKDYAEVSTGSIYSARGCNKACEFCTVSRHWNYSYRPRPVQSILKEMEILLDYGFSRIHFKDESMLQDRERAMQLFTAIKEHGFNVGIKGKARLDQLDPELLETMKGAGVDMLHIGVESVSEQSLRDMHKGVSRKDIQANLEMILAQGIGVNPVYMFSWPGETISDLAANADFIKEFGSNDNVTTYISFITPHPGTRLRKKAIRKKLRILTNDLDRYNHKTPVAFPQSLGRRGLELMIDTYHNLARVLDMEHVNPEIDLGYRYRMISRQRLAA
ncbi:MAG: radical SAM protein [archaeon]|nr:radical SAM protein [archaeon]